MNLVVAAAAGLALGMSLFAYALRRHWVYEPSLALLLGAGIGPVGLGWIDPRLDRPGGSALLEAVARFTLAIALVTVGLELRGVLGPHRRPLAVLIGGGAVLMWLASSVLVGLVLTLPLLTAVLIGAVLAPTDPILTVGVTTGRLARETVPDRIRHLLAAESSARHGLGLILVLLPVAWHAHSRWEAIAVWSRDGLLWKGAVAVAIGAVLGACVGRLHQWSAGHHLTETSTGPLVPLLLGLALATTAAVEAIGSDGVLAVLAAGLAFAWTRTERELGPDLREEVDTYQHLVKQLLQVPVFVVFGAALPWHDWLAMGWRAPVLIGAVLLLRRIPAVLLLRPWLSDLRSLKEALFVGWFGPIGVGALFFAIVAEHETGIAEVWITSSLLIAVTIIVHDLTITPLSQRLGQRDVRMEQACSLHVQKAGDATPRDLLQILDALIWRN